MAKGFDTEANCSHAATKIKAAGYDFVGRYLSRNTAKAIGAAEAHAVTTAGLGVVLVYEDGPTAVGYFSPDRGTSDGLRAAHQASLISAPAGTTIYFAVDYDAAEADLAAAIIPYFQAVAASFQSAVAQNDPQYRIGAYGSGMVCTALARAGLANQGWLSCSRGWQGYAAYTSWSIRQSVPAKICGLSVDPDEATGDYGAIPPQG
jgi:hypothetical protein